MIATVADHVGQRILDQLQDLTVELGLLTDHGVSDEDAGYYEGRIQDGGVFVSVDTAEAGISAATAQDILSSYGGHSASRAKTWTSTSSAASASDMSA